MKNSIITLVLFLLIFTGFSQNSEFEYSGRLTPSIKKAKLNEARFINEIMPQFGRFFALPYNERVEFDKRNITIYSQNYFYPQQNYNYMIGYVSIEISATCNGKVLTSQSKSDTLTTKQKNILNTVDLGTDISVKIKFNFKNQTENSLESAGNTKEGEYIVTVIPETEAVYPGGFKQFTEYLKENVFDKISEKSTSEKIQQAVVKFAVNEEGQIVDARISKTSTVPKIDQLLLDATNKMPKWTPAESTKGKKVKQEFSIPLGGGGC